MFVEGVSLAIRDYFGFLLEVCFVVTVIKSSFSVLFVIKGLSILRSSFVGFLGSSSMPNSCDGFLLIVGSCLRWVDSLLLAVNFGSEFPAPLYPFFTTAWPGIVWKLGS